MYFIISDLKKIRPEMVELIVSLFFATSCLLLFWLLPTEIKGRSDIIEAFLRSFVVLLLFPVLYVRIILKKGYQDMFLGKSICTIKIIIPMIFSLAVGVLSIVVVTQSFLADYYYSLVNYLAVSFKVFLIYEIFVAIFYMFFVIFSFGFINLITEKFNRLNRILPILIYYLLSLNFFKSSGEILLINLLMILPILFFRKIVNVSRSIWLFYVLILILNIILNAVIIKI